MRMDNNKLVVLLPAYNEEKDVEKLIERWEEEQECIKEHGLELEITVINDGSHDKTQSICQSLEQKYTNVHLINHEKNKGLGKAVETGFKYIVQNQPHCIYVCLMDCDNTQNPKYIDAMLHKIEDSNINPDVIIASRYQKGAEVYGLAWHRRLMSQGARWVYSLFFHVKNVRDYTCGFRLYRASAINQAFQMFGDCFIEQKGFTCMAEILYKLSCLNMKFAEIPFKLHYEEKGGASKMNVIKTVKDSFRLAIHLKKIKRKEFYGEKIMPLD